MARITVEDCMKNVQNRFQLVHLSSQRVRQLMKGSRPLVDNTFTQNRIVVVSLREIAAGKVRPAREDEKMAITSPSDSVA